MKRGTAWPLAVTTMLGLTVAANIWLIRVAGGDPSFAVEENYYERGVRWDDELEQRAHNRELGWRLAAKLSPIQQESGALLRITLADSAVMPISGASVVVRAVHVARAGHPMELTLAAGAPGEYEVRVPIARAGIWELRIDVQRGKERFTATERLDVHTAQP
jgi:nitrogen fixation protein FixH